ncbi:MlaD family protein [Paraconexibacter antarcticus]|uniref:MlaD family protein n=1 Tax=Paraconexibacter antarcticus TaxID=2949664 RepID=A0ABY5E1L7_9ACTN|nr:MlaD family protein [Paraconexibacter antarcticus]UTI66732.1 MlaD family protein [Paraconexibacter antarcticus]
METRLPPWRSLVLPGLFVLTCIVGGIFMWRSFGGDTPLQARGYRINVPLTDAPNLFPGSDVRIAGLSVGKITRVTRRGTTADAQLDIRPEFVPVRAGTRATLRSKSLLGEGFLELTPPRRKTRAIPDGGALRAADIVPAQRLDDVLGTFDPATRADLRALARGLARATRGAGGDVNQTLGEAEPATAGLQMTLGVLDRQGTSLRQLVANSATVVSALGRHEGALRSAITGAGRVFAVTAARNRALRRTVRALPPFLVALRGTARTLGAANADLQPAASALAGVAPAVRPALLQLRAVAPEARRTLDAVAATLPAADRGLPALRRILGAAAPALDALHPVLREALPVLQLLATVRDSAVTTFAGVSQIHNGTFLAEDGRVQHYANGIITLWNESIGGWVRRLPSNRGNTYPKPGFLDKIATGLESFDCRHVHNPNYLPPFGGTPPCITQGPWTFNGERRYYPTLQPAPP